jgi:hypothetical protein
MSRLRRSFDGVVKGLLFFLLYDLDTDIYKGFLWHSDLVGVNTGARRKSNVYITIGGV